MKFKFSQYEYQSDAAKAVVDVFKGQPLQGRLSYVRDLGVSKTDIRQNMLHGNVGLFAGSDMDDSAGYRNADIALDKHGLQDNLKKVQGRQGLPTSNELYEGNGAVELDVEMETGTGKTFVYTKTILELNRQYGWTKFIIVVPSIAIREGVAQSLESTRQYFYTAGVDGTEGYRKRLNWFIYDSGNLTELDRFAGSSDIQVMIINMQAFNTSMKEKGKSKASRIMFTERDEFGSRRPIDVISAVRPIVILDEPQKMGGKATQKGIGLFKPLFVLNYSATHKQHHDLVYKLDALDAYNQRLVKRIEVKGFELRNMSGTDEYVYLQDIRVSRNKAPQAVLEYKKINASGRIVTAMGTFNEGDNLYTASREIEAYRDDWQIAPDGIVPDQDGRLGYVRFLNGVEVHRGEVINDSSERDLRRVQIRETIWSHLEKEESLWERGIKCLSLFFIDEVSKYRQYDEDNKPVKGEYARIFEEEYDKCVHLFLQGRLDDGHGYLDYLRRADAGDVHKGYFSIDKNGHSVDTKTKGKEQVGDDESDYDLILRDKERLLSFDEPTRFIFSHSALREGWDNPNIFQICTLKHSNSEISKRQEVGRGLRLCVDKNGVRQDINVLGDQVQDINKLTVIASESYAEFTDALQKDMSAELDQQPVSIDDAFFAKLKPFPVQLLSEADDISNDEPKRYITFSKEESKRLHRLLIHHYLVDDDNDQLTDKYKEVGLQLSNEELIKLHMSTEKISAVTYVLNTVLEQATAKNMIANGMAAKIISNPLNDNWDKREFQELWKRINHKYAYTVNFDDKELVDNAIEAINGTNSERGLTVSRLSYTKTQGIQETYASRDDLEHGTHFTGKRSETYNLDSDANNDVSYDLLGEIAQAATITRKCAAEILFGIRADKFSQFKVNPEEFIAKVARLIVQAKADIVIDRITYNRIEGEYDSSVFTEHVPQDQSKAYQADKNIQDYVFPDGTSANSVEARFARSLDEAGEVAVYAKLPRGFQIPTPMGGYAPDWAIAFNENGEIKHLYFVAETKGTMEAPELRSIEKSKVDCAYRLFNKFHLADDVRYEQVNNYENLLDLVKGLEKNN
ncbi:DEAD/DEAH box helicase family protein [Bifidobacterium sp. ESL0790]|uniref:restriction endonuclease n=1 Tax=Bifidobacterium sp. ESL0790 TaxID=2983233 RepID=UPI0023F77C4A|nr:DEAD/DEAH box helicase family protein [Bifidobacterium sp. ESL0790]WEV71997.1 DEAD/DEAH box helicase family protein [Bifidobacterium sp. ESL0790]